MKNELLKNLCKIIGGNPAPNEFPNIEEGVPFIKMKDLGRYHLTNNLVEIENIIELNSKFKLIKKGSVLLPRSGSVGLNHRAILGKDSYMVSHICALEVLDENLLFNGFLYYYLTTVDMKRFLKKTTGLDAITFESLGKIQIPIPPIPEQKRIAAILDKADALRQKNKQLLAAYDELLQVTFLELFGDPVTNPKGWEKKTLSDVSEVVSGVTKGRKIDKEKVVLLPYIRVANVQDGHLVLNEIKAIEALPSDLEKYRLLPRDILLTEGGDPDKLGRGAVWRGEIEDCIHQNHIFRVRISDKNLKEAYLSALIGSSYGKSYFLKAAKQTTGIASINATQLRNFPVIMAPFQLQEKFEIAIANIEAQKAILKQSIQESEDLFNGLVQKAFNGEL